VVFVVQFVLPGDPVRTLAPRTTDPVVLDRIREQLQLDDPTWQQFLRYVGGLVHGDLGESYVRRQSVAALIWARLPATILLAVAGVAVAVAIGSLLGMWSAIKRAGRRTAYVTELVLLSVPAFTLGLLLLLLFGFRLGWLPTTGGVGLPQLILPAITLGLVGVPYYAQVVDEEVRKALSSGYVRTAVSKGLPRLRVVRRHVLRNVLPVVVTVIALDLGAYLSGVVVIETVFGWPGIGALAVQAFGDLDRPVVLGVSLLAAFAVGLSNFVADVSRGYVDPRTRVAGSR
jgi:peptide/nickel transport system permease protein